MPTVDELLNASNEVTTCTINPDTREIIVPEKYKVLGVFSDEKVTKIPFTCPRVVGNNVDLTEYNLYINYQNASGASNAYLIDDLVVSGENITFSWLLSRYVTFSPGVVKYSFCAKKSDGDTISNEWNTTIATGLVIQGLEATREIIEENPDIIEALISKAHTHENKAVLDKFAESDGKPTYDGEVLGKRDVFIIKATAIMNEDGTYEVINPTSTLAEIEAAVEDGKVPIALVETSRTSTVILQLKSCDEGTCVFSTMMFGNEAQLYVMQEDQERWYFIVSSQTIEADGVYYTSFGSVGGALDELVPKSHTHANKDTLDKLSVSNGKLQYNGSDVGLKGDKGDTGAAGAPGESGADGKSAYQIAIDNGFVGSQSEWLASLKGATGASGVPGKDGTNGSPGADGITPTIGTNGNWYLGTSDTGKPSRGEKGDKGDTGATGLKGADGKTPVKGTDYWTAADKQEIVNDVIAALPDGTEVSY